MNEPLRPSRSFASTSIMGIVGIPNLPPSVGELQVWSEVSLKKGPKGKMMAMRKRDKVEDGLRDRALCLHLRLPWNAEKGPKKSLRLGKQKKKWKVGIEPTTSRS